MGTQINFGARPTTNVRPNRMGTQKLPAPDLQKMYNVRPNRMGTQKMSAPGGAPRNPVPPNKFWRPPPTPDGHPGCGAVRVSMFGCLGGGKRRCASTFGQPTFFGRLEHDCLTKTIELQPTRLRVHLPPVRARHIDTTRWRPTVIAWTIWFSFIHIHIMEITTDDQHVCNRCIHPSKF